MKPFAVLVDEAGRLLGRTDDSTATKIKESMNRWYRRVQRSKKWKGFSGTEQITVASGAQHFSLPQKVGEINQVWDLTNDLEVQAMDDEDLVRRSVADFDTRRTPYSYALLGEFGVKLQPSVSATIKFVSTSAADTMISVRIVGFATDVPIEETITLNGTSNVVTTLVFTEVRTITKGARTAGIVIITDNTTAASLADIGPSDYAAAYKWIRLGSPSDTARTLNISYKVKVPELVNDNDQPWINCDDVLIHGAHSDILKSLRQFGQAREAERAALEALNDLMSEEIGQAGDYGFSVQTGRRTR